MKMIKKKDFRLDSRLCWITVVKQRIVLYRLNELLTHSAPYCTGLEQRKLERK